MGLHAVVLIESGPDVRGFLCPTLDGARLLVAQIAHAMGLDAPSRPNTTIGPRGGRLGFYVGEVEHGAPAIALVVEQGFELRVALHADPIAAMRAGIFLEQGTDWRLVRFESPSGLVLVTPAEQIARSVALSNEICPRCADHPLSADPADDPRSLVDGRRVCVACGSFERLGRVRHDPGSAAA